MYASPSGASCSVHSGLPHTGHLSAIVRLPVLALLDGLVDVGKTFLYRLGIGLHGQHAVEVGDGAAADFAIDDERLALTLGAHRALLVRHLRRSWRDGRST